MRPRLGASTLSLPLNTVQSKSQGQCISKGWEKSILYLGERVSKFTQHVNYGRGRGLWLFQCSIIASNEDTEKFAEGYKT